MKKHSNGSAFFWTTGLALFLYFVLSGPAAGLIYGGLERSFVSGHTDRQIFWGSAYEWHLTFYRPLISCCEWLRLSDYLYQYWWSCGWNEASGC